MGKMVELVAVLKEEESLVIIQLIIMAATLVSL